MSSEQNSSRWLRVPWRLAGAAVLLIVIALLWWSGTRESPLDKEITRRLAELRASGEPVDASDLARLFPNPPPAEDAGVLLTNILVFAADNRPPAASPIVNPKVVLTRAKPFSEPVMVELRAYHHGTKAVWDQWPKPWPTGMRFASHWEKGMMSNSVPNFIKVRILVQMLATLAMTAAEDNDPQRAADMLERGFRFAQTIPSDSLVTHMIKVACVGLGVTATERCLNRTSLSDNQLIQLASSLPQTETNEMANALRGEHCMALWAFGELKAGRHADDMFISPPANEKLWEKLWRKWKARGRVYSDTDFVSYLKLCPASLEITTRTPTQAIAGVTMLVNNYRTNVNSEMGRAVPASLSKALTADLETGARVMVLRAALSIERFRLAHEGKIPATLKELVPEHLAAMPRDIFDGQPLRFKTLPRGYVLYSIGADGVDDGGLEKTNNAARYDLTITVER